MTGVWMKLMPGLTASSAVWSEQIDAGRTLNTAQRVQSVISLGIPRHHHLDRGSNVHIVMSNLLLTTSFDGSILSGDKDRVKTDL